MHRGSDPGTAGDHDQRGQRRRRRRLLRAGADHRRGRAQRRDDRPATARRRPRDPGQCRGHPPAGRSSRRSDGRADRPPLERPEAGIAELRRIARRRIVIFTFDPDLNGNYWLLREYLPQLVESDPGAAVPLNRLVAALGGRQATTVTPVPIPHDCTDGFVAAFWRRPAAYLDPAVRAGMSLFTTAQPDIVTAGLDHLARDLDSGAWQHRHADLLDLTELDVGYRLLTTDLATA